MRATFLQFTLLPMPAGLPPAAGWARRGAWAWPVAGAVVGTLGAGALATATAIGLPPLLAAIVALSAMALATGALHEDGLADFADGIGGGRDRESRLQIMRDSRLGSYGALALLLAVLWRLASIAALPETIVIAALVCCAAAARWAAALLSWRLQPASPDGQSALAGRAGTFAIAAGGLLCLVLGWQLLSPALALVPMISALCGAGLVGLLARRRLGGQTGDVLGAAVQTAEMISLAALLAIHF